MTKRPRSLLQRMFPAPPCPRRRLRRAIVRRRSSAVIRLEGLEARTLLATLANIAIDTDVEEGQMATLTGDIVEGDPSDTLTLQVEWGDGALSEYTYPAGTTSFSETHQYLDDPVPGTPYDEVMVNLSLTSVPLFRVDFGRNTGGDDPLQPNWMGFNHDGTDATSRSFPSDYFAGPGNSVDVTVAGNTHWRDYAAIASGPMVGQSALLSDSVLCNAACTLTITLDNLLDGDYEIVTYHHNTQFFGGGTTHDIVLTDGVVTAATMEAGIPTTGGTSPGQISTRTVPFTVVGGSAVELQLVSNATASSHMSINGFELRQAPRLRVDFGRDTNGDDPLQAGWSPFSFEGTATDTVSFPDDELAGTGNSVDVTVGGNTHWRDYAAVTSGPYAHLSNLLSDHVLCNAACTMSVTLENLQDGQYDITTYHHNTQLGGGTNRHDILLTDGLGSDQSIHSDVPTTGGATPTTISQRTTTANVVGGSPVRLDFPSNATAQEHTSINGFDLVRQTASRASTFIRVHNVAPDLADMSLDATALEGDAVTLSGTIVDPGLDSHAVLVDWGDGTVERVLLAAGQSSLAQQHAYADNGRYEVTIQVNDDDSDVLMIDFGQSTNGDAPLQNHWRSFINDGTATITNSFTSESLAGSGNSVDVTVGGNTHWRDYAAVTGGPYAPLSNLLADHVLCNASCTMNITLEHLLEGDYQITTFHHNTQFGGGPALLDIVLTDGVVTGQTVHTDILTTGGQSPAQINQRTTNFTVVGGSAVQLDFPSDAISSSHSSINGFIITRAPRIETLQVDFSQTPDGDAPLQAGWLGYTHDGTDAITQNFPNAALAGPGNAVSVTVAGATHWRDYVEATGIFAPLSDMLRDGPLRNAAGTMTLSFEDLLEGNYELTLYFHTTQNGPNSRVPNPVEVRLNDGLGLGQLIDGHLYMSDNASLKLSTLTIPVTVDNSMGFGTVSVDMNKSAGDDHFAMPGFELRQVPSGTAKANVMVKNVAPAVSVSGAMDAGLGVDYTLNLSAMDPGDDTISGWTIDWGDGSVEAIPGNPPTATHVYMAPGDFQVSAVATDEDGQWDSYSSSIANQQPIGYWRLREDGGALADDVTDFDRDLKYVNFAPTAFEQVGPLGAGTAPSLQTATQNSIVADSPADFAFPAGQAFSYEFWINGNIAGNVNGTGVLTKGYETNAQATPWYLSRVLTAAGTTEMFTRNSANTSFTASGTAVVLDDTWHHVLAVYDPTTAENRLYVDGALDATVGGVVEDAFGTNNRRFQLGVHFGRFYTGLLSEVAMYDRSLTAEEAMSHYVAAGEHLLDVHVAAVGPQAIPGGPYVISEGDALQLDGTSSANAANYTWDINGDGVFGDATGSAPSLSWDDLRALNPPIDDDGTYTVTLRVDDGTDMDEASVSLTVNNVAPMVTVSGATEIDEGATFTLNFSAANDPGNDAINQWSIDWGDGTSETFPGNAASATHVYPNDGVFAVGLLAMDDDGSWAAYESTILADMPIGYWRLSDTAGADTATDSTGNGRDLVYTNFADADYAVAGVVTGEDNTAVRFSPTGQTISSPDTTQFAFAAGQSFSLEYWTLIDPANVSADNTGIIDKGYDSIQERPWYLSRYLATGQVDFFLRDVPGTNGLATSTSVIDDGQWHHVVGVYDASAAEVRIYVDGVHEGTGVGVPEADYGTNNRPFIIGNHLNRAFDGLMDEVAIYDVALSDQQIADHYGASAGALTVHVSNVAPSLEDVVANSPVDEGDAATVSGRIVEPGVEDSVTVRIDWGDGSVDSYTYPAGTSEFSESHVYSDDNPAGTASDDYQVQLTVDDTPPLELWVDFGQSTNGDDPLQDGYQPFSFDGTTPVTNSFDGVDVTVSGNTHWRDYSAITDGPFVDQSNLLSDQVLCNAACIIRLAFDNLPDGNYEITTFHHNTQLGGGATRHDIVVTDALVTSVVAHFDVETTGGTTPETISQRTTAFTAASGLPVILEFPASATSGEHMSINGFQLVRLPGASVDGPVITVNNVAPTAMLSGDGPVAEGSTAVVSFSGQADVSAADVAAGFRYAYDFDNDGTFDVGDGTYAGSVPDDSATVPSTALDDGDVAVTVRARILDDDGGFSDYTASIDVTNVAPTATLASGGAVAEGSTGQVTFSAASDPSAGDVAAGFRYAYDLDNDGTFDVGDGTYGGSSSAATAMVPANLLSDGDAVVTVRGRILDDDGGFTDYTTTITVNNVSPTATLQGGTVVEGGTATVSFSGQTDPSAADAQSLRYAYDFDNDGTFDMGDGTYAGSIANSSASAPASLAVDGPGTFTVRARVLDDDGGFTDYNTTVNVTNAPPVVTVSGVSQTAPSQPQSFTLVANDPSTVDQAAGFTYSIDWGDATGETTSPGQSSPLVLDHAFPALGTYTVTVTATDKDGGVGTATHVVEVSPVIQTGDTVLVGGTDGRDRIIIQAAREGVVVRYNDIYFGPFSTTEAGQIVVSGGGGGDTISVAGNVKRAVELHGDDGNDRLVGATKDDRLFGGPGNDQLLGGEGNNWLDGGSGNDSLSTRDGDDTLLGGTGNDVLYAGSGRDMLDGGIGNDRLSGSEGDDVIRGGEGNDFAFGGAGDDILIGDDGRDRLRGDRDRDILIGGFGDDALQGHEDSDLLVGGATQIDQDDAALASVLSSWTDPSASLDQRLMTIADMLGAGTIIDDGEEDGLIGGGSGDALFLAAGDFTELIDANDRLLL